MSRDWGQWILTTEGRVGGIAEKLCRLILN